MKKKTVFLLLGVVLILAVIKIFLAAKMATTGSDLDQMAKDAQRLEAQNLLLKEEITSLSSLSQISAEAKRLGFARSEKIVSITGEIPLAFSGPR